MSGGRVASGGVGHVSPHRPCPTLSALHPPPRNVFPGLLLTQQVDAGLCRESPSQPDANRGLLSRRS